MQTFIFTSAFPHHYAKSRYDHSRNKQEQTFRAKAGNSYSYSKCNGNRTAEPVVNWPMISDSSAHNKHLRISAEFSISTYYAENEFLLFT